MERGNDAKHFIEIVEMFCRWIYVFAMWLDDHQVINK